VQFIVGRNEAISELEDLSKYTEDFISAQENDAS
jgi:hypothetical protein